MRENIQKHVKDCDPNIYYNSYNNIFGSIFLHMNIYYIS